MKRGGRLGVVLRWAGIVVACALIAVVLARWWTVRSEAQFAARLRSAPLSELEVLSRKRAWDPEVFYWLGARLTSENRHREAAQALAQSAALNPRSAAARAAFGLALARLDRPQDAEAQLKAAVELDPKLQFAHFALGNLYGRNKRWEKAVKALKAAAELDPNDLEAQYLLALSYGEMFQEDRKMEVLERLVKRAPNEIRFLKSLGFIYLFFGKFAQAEATYRHILELDPKDLEARYVLGRALAEQASSPQAFVNAEKELKSVAAKVPDNPGVQLALGILYFRRNEPAQAIRHLERAVKLGTTENKTWLYLGQSYMRAGREAEGKRTLAQFQRGARMSRTVSQLENRLLNIPGDTPAQVREKNELRLRLVRVYMEDTNYPRAVGHLRILLESDPGNIEGQKLLRECQTRSEALAAKAAAAPRQGAPPNAPGPMGPR